MGPPLERGPSPLQSCTITTAGNGPSPSGLISVAGIVSDAPTGVMVRAVWFRAARVRAEQRERKNDNDTDIKIRHKVRRRAGSD